MPEHEQTGPTVFHIEPGVFVRPMGTVPDHPIVRQVGERALYLGNRHAADPDRHDLSFEHVLSVTADPFPLTTHHRQLVDSEEASFERFRAAVETARRLHDREGSLLVHCKAGISRSSTVIATTLAAEEKRTLAEAFDAVHAARPIATPHPRLHELAVVYLAAVTPP